MKPRARTIIKTLKVLTGVLGLYFAWVGVIGVLRYPYPVAEDRLIGTLCLLLAVGYLGLLFGSPAKRMTVIVIAICIVASVLGRVVYGPLTVQALLTVVALSVVPLLLWLLERKKPNNSWELTGRERQRPAVPL